MKVGYLTDIGKRRSRNEDSFLADADHGIFIIADGMGGHRGGEVASRLAVEVIGNDLNARMTSASLTADDIPAAMLHAFSHANKEILSRSQADEGLSGMGTTAVAACVLGTTVCLAHVGDSRAYLIEGATIQQVTGDHSLVARMTQSGEITSEEGRKHPLRHILSQALGASSYAGPDVRSVTLNPGAYILLCTDGLNDALDDAEILSAITDFPGDAERICSHLVDRANANGGPDNITVILLYGEESRKER